jgi:hypothetical protein
VAFAVGDVADPLQAFLDGPLPAKPRPELVRWGVFGGEVGDGVHGFRGPFLAVQPAAFPGDLDGLTGVWESDAGGHGDGFEFSSLSRPWPRSFWVSMIGTSAQGSDTSWVCGVGWFRFTVSR